MQPPASENDILDFNNAAEIFGGIQPLLSSANSKWDGLLIEIYQIPKFGPTPRLCYSDRHVVSVQRAGVIQSHEDESPRYWYPGSVWICPVRAPQTSYTFLDARFTIVMLDPAFVRQAIGDAVNADSMEILSEGYHFATNNWIICCVQPKLKSSRAYRVGVCSLSRSELHCRHIF